MKKRIALEQIAAGSRFTEDVFIDDANLLVPARIPVKQKDIDALKRWGVAFVLTEGELLAEEAKPAKAEGAKAATAEEIRREQGFAGSRELYRKYTELVDKLAQVFDKIRKGEAVEPKNVDLIAQGILQLVRDERDAAISAILGAESPGSELAKAGVNTAILSTVIGQTLRLPAYKLSYLATGALLHDVGMLRIPDSIVKKRGGSRRRRPRRSAPIPSSPTVFPRRSSSIRTTWASWASSTTSAGTARAIPGRRPARRSTPWPASFRWPTPSRLWSA